MRLYPLMGCSFFTISEDSALCSSLTRSDLFPSKGRSAGRSNGAQMIREHWQSRVLATLWCCCHMELAVRQRYYYYHQMVRWCLFPGLSWLSLAIGLITRCCCVLPGHEPTIGGHCRVGTFPCRHGRDQTDIDNREYSNVCSLFRRAVHQNEAALQIVQT